MSRGFADVCLDNSLLLAFVLSLGCMFVALPVARVLQWEFVSIERPHSTEVIIYPPMLQNAVVVYNGRRPLNEETGLNATVSYEQLQDRLAVFPMAWSNLVERDIASAPVVLLNLYTIGGPVVGYALAPISILADPGDMVWAAHIDRVDTSISSSPLLRLIEPHLVPR